MSSVAYATVKAVPSGDTLILQGQPTKGPPPELQLTLASIIAPRIGRTDGANDEPFAWQAREFLRKLCIGRRVRFSVEYSVQAINRSEFLQQLGGTLFREGLECEE